MLPHDLLGLGAGVFSGVWEEVIGDDVFV